MLNESGIIGGSDPITNYIVINNSSYFILPETFDYATDLIITVPDGVYLFRYWWLVILMFFSMIYIGKLLTPYIYKPKNRDELNEN